MQRQLTSPMDLAMAVRLALPATSFCFLALHTPSADCQHPICNRGTESHFRRLCLHFSITGCMTCALAKSSQTQAL